MLRFFTLLICIFFVEIAFADEFSSSDFSFDKDAAIERIRAEIKKSSLAVISQISQDKSVISDMTRSIIGIQPYYRSRDKRAYSLATAIYTAAQKHDQNPWIALSIAVRESGLRPEVGNLKIRGSRGELGYFQVMPNSQPQKICGKNRSMKNAFFNADTALCWLSYVQSYCSTSDPWQYVAAYGMSRCPGARESRRMRSTQKARQLLCDLVGDQKCEKIWPS